MCRDFLDRGFVPAPPVEPADTDERLEVDQDTRQEIAPPSGIAIEVRTTPPADALEIAPDL